MRTFGFIGLFLSFNFLYGQGMIFNKDSFLKFEKIGRTRGEYLSKKSIEKYTPIPLNQIGKSCVALSFTNARHTLLALELDRTDVKSKTLLFSPYHFYHTWL